MKKTSVTKYKRKHRWNITTQNQGFCKDVDLQISQASRNKELRVSHNVFSSSPRFFQNFASRLRTSTLKLDLGSWWWPKSVLLQTKWICFCWDQLENSSSPLETILDKPIKKFEKVVSGRDLHGVTSRKRWEDCYIFSLWGNGQEIVRKRLNYPKFVKNCSFFTISQRIAVRKTTELLEVQNMSKGGWKTTSVTQYKRTHRWNATS